MKRKTSESEVEYGVYEVYYNEDGSIKGWTENSMTPVIDNPEGLKHELEIMLLAFEKEILDYTD